MEVTNSATLQLLKTPPCQIAPVLKLIKNSMQCCMVSLNFQKEQRNMTELSKTLPTLSPLSHILTVKSLHKIFVTASVWVSIRNLLKRPCPILIKLTRAIDVISLLSNRNSLPNNISLN